jgi:hypothetical protein
MHSVPPIAKEEVEKEFPLLIAHLDNTPAQGRHCRTAPKVVLHVTV